MPSTLGNLANLQDLTTGYANSFTNSLPPDIGDCSRLRYIRFASSNLSGTISWEIAKLHKLKDLYLFDNQLDGSINLSIGNRKALEVFATYGKKLCGHIPREFTHLRRHPQYLWLHLYLLLGFLLAYLVNIPIL